MIIDDLVKENEILKQQNAEFKQELHWWRYSLWSVLNILEPEQKAIIQHDLIDIEYIYINYAQPEF